MKQLIDIIRESIFDIDDKQIADKPCIELKYSFLEKNNSRSEEKIKRMGLTRKDIENFLLSIRDNEFSVEQKLYTTVEDILFNNELGITVYHSCHNSLIGMDKEIHFNLYEDSRCILCISIDTLLDYSNSDNHRNPSCSSWQDKRKKVYKNLEKYAAAAVDAIYNSTGSKYDKFKKLLQ